jgi:prolyl 4-hydroxylase
MQNTIFEVRPHLTDVSILNSQKTAQVLRQDLDKAQVYMLRQVMFPKECRALIDYAEALGFTKAGLAIGDDQYRVNEKARNNLRVIIDSKEMAAILWERVRPCINVQHEGARVVGLNERFRVYKYEAGHHFSPHYDLRTKLPKGETRFSFIIYLSNAFMGGGTRFFEEKNKGSRRGQERGKKFNNQVRFCAKPPIGGAVVFDHQLLHEGELVTSGVKYAVRTDVIYNG